jgi:UDP-glucuronate 4-epimerase
MSAKLNLILMQDGAVRKSHANDVNLIKNFDYAPKWSVKKGVKNFIQWYTDYYKVNLPTH